MSGAKKSKKFLIFLVLVVLIFAVIWLTVFISNKQKQKKIEKNATYVVTKEIVKNVIEISGTVEAAKSQSLQAAADGMVMAVYANEGDSVKKGQVLVELDTSSQEYDIAKIDYDIAQTRINGNPKELELKLIQKKSLEKKLEDRKIIANFSGILADFDVAPGDYLEAKDSVGTLVERSYLKSYVEVVETDAPKLAANQIVYCTFPSYPDHTVEGYVVSYPQVGTLTSRGASIVQVEIRIDNPPQIILPNYSFTGQIQITPPQTILLAPKEAVSFSPKGSFVEKVLKDGKKERVTVVAEPYGMSHFLITQGAIQEGDVLSGLSLPPVSGTKPVNKKKTDVKNPMMNGFGNGMQPARR